MKVYVGMSGGVDSSVAAALLKEQGHDVIGVYMKNWTKDLPGMKCPWAEDLADAKRVAVQLGIPFKVFDFEAEYKRSVVNYMINEYKAGRTPNPDIMCNQEVKFKLFLETALEDGADMIATGHYARVMHSTSYSQPSALGPVAAGKPPHGARKLRAMGAPPSAPPSNSARDGLMFNLDFSSAEIQGDTVDGAPVARNEVSTMGKLSGVAGPSREAIAGDELTEAELLTGVDSMKDQSYFLYRVTEKALRHTLMPVGEFEKLKIRELAAERGLITASKKDSQGICFVGKVGMKEFLSQYVMAEPGPIIDVRTNKEIGQHDGAIFYTIGQRQGLGVGGGLPFYVIGKDMEKNIVYVTTKLDDEHLWSEKLELTSLHWINKLPKVGQEYHVRSRYRARLVPATVMLLEDGQLTLKLQIAERAVTPGQSTVLYDGERVVGGGIVI